MQLAFDQLLFAPTILSALFFLSGVVESPTWSTALSNGRNQVVQQIYPTLITNWMVWPLVQMANMGLVVPDRRLLVVNLVSIPWTGYLASRTSAASPKQTDEKVELPLVSMEATE